MFVFFFLVVKNKPWDCRESWSGNVFCLCLCCRLLVTVVFGAVSLSGTRRSATISVPLEKTSSVIFLLPMPATAIFSMAQISSGERSILVVGMLVNFRFFGTNEAVVHCHESVMCNVEKPVVLSKI